VIKPGAQQGQHPRRAGVDTVVYKLVTAAVAKQVRVNIIEADVIVAEFYPAKLVRPRAQGAPVSLMPESLRRSDDRERLPQDAETRRRQPMIK
jgi:hypothetical protein